MQNVMHLGESPKAEKDRNYLDKVAKKRISVFFQSAGFTLAMIASFGALGYLIDKQLGTTPYFFIGLLIVSYPVNLVLLVKKTKKTQL